MSGYLLDTNVISELRKGDRADAQVRTWFNRHIDDELWLSVLVIGELRRGVELLRRRDEPAAAGIDTWLRSVVDDFADRILDITADVAQRWALLNVPDPVPVIDGLLAATALEHDLVLVTRNVGDIARTGVLHVDPFAASER